MSRATRLALGVLAALAIVGSAAAVTMAVVTSNSQSKAIDARIDASIAADSAQESAAIARSTDAQSAAAAACEGLVRVRLKAPATAQFAVTSNEVGAPDGNAQGIVHGTVDSQNEFGALVRSDWTCMVLPGSTASAVKASITNIAQR